MRTRLGMSWPVRVVTASLMAVILQTHMCAESTIALKVLSSAQIAVDVTTSDTIVGMQFMVHLAHGLALRDIHKSDLIRNPEWMLDYNSTNDSTFIVVILDMMDKGLFPCSGSLAEITVIDDPLNTVRPSDLLLSGVVFASPKGNGLQVTIAKTEDASPQNPLLNYPNPFNPTTMIQYVLTEESQVNLRVYNIIGQEVKTLVSETQGAGTKTIMWDASEMVSGTYFCRLEATGISDPGHSVVLMKRMLFIK